MLQSSAIVTYRPSKTVTQVLNKFIDLKVCVNHVRKRKGRSEKTWGGGYVLCAIDHIYIYEKCVKMINGNAAHFKSF